MLNGTTIGAVVPAAGKGSRMGTELSKQFLELDGKPILLHTLERLQSIPEVDIIVVAAAEDRLDQVKEIVAAHRLTKVSVVIPGGAERQDSVWNCLRTLSLSKVDSVIVHDAVRPFISRDIVCNVCNAAKEFGAAVPVVRPKDTIKVLNGEGFVSSTLERNSLVVVQTPQGFQFPLLYRSYERAMSQKFYGTDDASLVERYNGRVKIVEGDYHNIKITTPEDLAIAKHLMRKQSIA